ncbi:tyrosine-type recombinase/integrase [Ktedonosporobacter rubrisoli]|nr:tyrosine-type recombinase/integrase [Ktedonosporobacter rubrisoli]
MANKKVRKNGEGTLFKRKDGRWQASFIPKNGRRKYVYGKTANEALERLRSAQKEDKEGTLATGPRQKLRDYLVQWLETTHKPPLSRHSTYIQYRWAIRRHLAPALGHIQLQKLTPQHVQVFYAKLLQSNLKPSSITVIHAVLHVALENAIKWKLVSYNVASIVTVPKRDRYEPCTLSDAEAQKLIRIVRESGLEAILLMAVTTAMRRGELLSLRWSDIDLDSCTLRIKHTVNRLAGYGFVENDPKSSYSRRKIVLPHVVIDALKRHQERQNAYKSSAKKWVDRDLVFPNTQGNFLKPDRLLKMFQKALDQADLPHMRFHDLRHSAATILLQMGIHPKVVQELLGHSTIAMTMDVYSHLLPSMHKDAMNGMDDLFGN